MFKRLSCALLLVACGGSSIPPAEVPPASPAPGTADAPPRESALLAASTPDGSGPPVAVLDGGASTSIASSTSTPTGSAIPPSSPPPVPPTADDADTGDPGSVAYLESVQALLKKNRDDLTKACWLKSKSTERAYAGKVAIRVGPGGKIASIQTDGTDDAASACLTKQIKKWHFPPPNGTATVSLPIRLHRD